MLLERGFNLVEEQYDDEDMGPSNAELLEAADSDPRHTRSDQSFLG